MPTPRLVQIQPISAWSYSRYQTYGGCPRKAKYLYIEKKREPDSSSGLKGTRVHAIAAVVASGELPRKDKDNILLLPELKTILKAGKIPDELITFEKEFKALKKLKPQVESKWAFNKNWEVTGWFDSDCWLRIKVDLHYLLVTKQGKLRTTRVKIVDHKTGKVHSDHDLQRELYALGALLVYDDAVEVEVSHWYLDAGEESEVQTWMRKDLEGLKKAWLDRVEAMMNDTNFAPNPTAACKWCHFSAKKAGPCEF